MKANFNKGLTLLEALLVLALTSVILVVSLRFVRFHDHEIFVERQKEALAITFLLMNQYYLTHCHNDLSTVTLDDLKIWATGPPVVFTTQELALIPDNFAIRYMGTQISAPQPYTIYRFVVSASYAGFTTAQLQQLRGELAADQAITNLTLTWTKMPREFNQKETLVNSLWIASMDLQAKIKIADQAYQYTCPQ
jgi:competence protein ComGC